MLQDVSPSPLLICIIPVFSTRGKNVFLKAECTNWLSSAESSALGTYRQVTLFGLNRFYLKICVYTYKRVITIEQDHEFEGEGEEHIRRFGEGKEREKHNQIIMSKKKVKTLTTLAFLHVQEGHGSSV